MRYPAPGIGRSSGPPGQRGTAGPVATVSPTIICQRNPMDITGTAVPASGFLYGLRQVIPFTGHLRDISVFFPAAQTGNVNVAVYDTGDALAGSRTLLTSQSAGEVAVSASAGWQLVYDPNLPVSAGQQIDLALVLDSGSSAGSFNAGGFTNVQGQLPSNYLVVPGGASPKLCWNTSAVSIASLPTTVTEANCVVSSKQWAIMARLA